MIPVLYKANETKFDSQGVGCLTDCITCYVHEKLNGVYELKFTYPITGVHFSDIKVGAIVDAIPSDGKAVQHFRIDTITKPIGGKVTVEATHISYQLSYVPVKPFDAVGVLEALNGLKDHSLTSNPFSVWTDISNTATKYTQKEPASFRQRLGGVAGSILDCFGGEYEFDNYTVKLHAHRGIDRGVVIEYGKNLTDLEQEESIDKVITGIVPFWKDSNDKVVSIETPIESEYASKYPFKRTVVKDFSSNFEEEPTVEQLRAYTESYIKNNCVGVPQVSLDVSFVALEDTEEYKSLSRERINLGDTVTVRFAELGVDAKAKVIEYKYDVLAERYDSLKIGSVRSSLASTISEITKVADSAVTKSILDAVIKYQTELIKGGLGGYVVTNYVNGYPSEIIVGDAPNIEQMVNCIRLNKNGLGISKTGYNGSYRTAITGEGINADLINFGELDGNLIKAKTLQIGSFDEATENTITSSLSEAVTEWYVSTSPTELKGGSWSESRPAWTETNYIWQRLRTENKKGEISYSEPSCVQGNTGAKGDKGEQGERGLQGIQGERGEQGVPGKDGLNGTNGKTSYFHIKYSSVANPTSSSQMTETPNTYIGTYVDYVEADSSDPSKYTWSRFQGIQGEKGDKGIPGTDGTNGKTSYLHIAYSNSADGKTGFDVSNSANKLYIGQYTDFNPTDSTDHTKYSWTKIKGEQGAQGAKGDKGNDGTSVKITAKSVTYQASSSGTTTPTGAWVANPPAAAKGQYLWTKTVVTYSDGNSTTAYSVAYQGTNGANGQNGTNGIGVKSTEVTYQIWTDGTTTPSGTWSTSVPDTTADKPYLWTRTIITYTDNTKSTSYSVGSTLKGVNVGGRNLFIHAKTSPGTTFEKGEEVNGFSTIWKTFVKNTFGYIDSYPHQSDLLIPRVGQTYTIQMMVRGRLYKKYAYKDYDLSSTNLFNIKTVEYDNSDGIYDSTAEPLNWVTAYSASSPDSWNALKNGTTHTVGSIERIVVRYKNELYDAYFYVISANGKSCNCYYVLIGEQNTGGIQQFWFPNVYGNGASDSRIKIKVSENWKLHSHQWTPSSELDSETQHSMILCRLQTDIGVGTVEIYAPKFELGNIATDWTPAPEDVDADISNAQTTANSAKTNASNAQSSANNALDTANKADAKADQAKSDAASANTAAQIAKKQADNAQAKSDEANRIANGAQIGVSNIEQVVKIDTQGVRIYEKANSKNYVHQKSDGSHFYTNNIENGVLGPDSRMNNLAVQDYLMFGAHRAELKIEDGEEGTALFHVGDIK